MNASDGIGGNISLDDLEKILGQHRETNFKKPEVALAFILSILALLLNTSSLFAMYKGKGRKMTANARLLVSLAVADMCVSISVFWQIGMGASVKRNDCLHIAHRSFRTSSHVVSLLNLCCLAADHYCAIVWPLHHAAVVSTERIKLAICQIWLISLLAGYSLFLPTSKGDDRCDNATYCLRLSCKGYDSEYFIFVLTPISLIVMSVLYTVIFVKIRDMSRFNHGRRTIQMERNRKGLITTLIILATFCLCFLPYCIFEIYAIIGIKLDGSRHMHYMQWAMHLDYYFYDLLLLNSLADPIIYAIRLREVRVGYRKIMRHCFTPVDRPPANSEINTRSLNTFVPLKKSTQANYHQVTAEIRTTGSEML